MCIFMCMWMRKYCELPFLFFFQWKAEGLVPSLQQLVVFSLLRDEYSGWFVITKTKAFANSVVHRIKLFATKSVSQDLLDWAYRFAKIHDPNIADISYSARFAEELPVKRQEPLDSQKTQERKEKKIKLCVFPLTCISS